MKRIHTKVVLETDELTHYGVLGMRWGYRKAQYDSSELSTRKKAKVEKQYVKSMNKAMGSMAKVDTLFQMKAHNKAAEEWNSSKLNEFNKKNNPKSKNYDEKLQKAFEEDKFKKLTALRIEYIKKDKNYQKGEQLVKKYDMLKYSDVAKTNAKDLAELKKWSI